MIYVLAVVAVNKDVIIAIVKKKVRKGIKSSGGRLPGVRNVMAIFRTENELVTMVRKPNKLRPISFKFKYWPSNTGRNLKAANNNKPVNKLSEL